MTVKFSNNASATLASSLTADTTTISLTAGNGAKFPTLGAGDYFYGTLTDSSGNLEIVKATARATDTLTVVRAQEGTVGLTFTAGDVFELRPTAAGLEDIQTILKAEIDLKAPIDDPEFTGEPKAPTPTLGTKNSLLATTEFVQNAIDDERTVDSPLENKEITHSTLNSSKIGEDSPETIKGTTIDGTVITATSKVKADTIEENSSGNGVNIESVNIKDGVVTASGGFKGNADTVTNGVYTTDFTGDNQTLTGNGRQVLPGGLVLVWGEFSSVTDGTEFISFHTPFDSTALFATTDFRNDYYPPVVGGDVGLTKSGFYFNRSDGLPTPSKVRYFAIGI